MTPERRKPSVQKQIEQPRLEDSFSLTEFLFPEQPEFPVLAVLEKVPGKPLEESGLLLTRFVKENGATFLRSLLLAQGKKKEIDLETARRFRETTGVVLFAEMENPGELEELLSIFAQGLKTENKLWVLEKTEPRRVGEEEKEKRLTLLKNHGFVERKLMVVSGEPFLLWQARKEKARKVMVIDLTLREWFPRARREAEARYIKQGWRSVNFAKIIEVCQKSQNPPEDYRRLIDGCGVRLQAFCGCEWEVSANGDWIRIVNCPDEDCSGVPYSPEK